MKPERITELRAHLDGWDSMNGQDARELLDALEAAQAQLAALRGGKVGSVYYPGICEDDIDEMWRTCESCADPARAMAVEGYKLAMDHLPAGTEILDPADPLPTTEFQRDAIARGEMADRLRVAEARVAVLERKVLVGDEVLELLCMEGDIRETNRLGLFVSGKVRDHLDNLDALRASQRHGQSEAGGGAG